MTLWQSNDRCFHDPQVPLSTCGLQHGLSSPPRRKRLPDCALPTPDQASLRPPCWTRHLSCDQAPGLPVGQNGALLCSQSRQAAVRSRCVPGRPEQRMLSLRTRVLCPGPWAQPQRPPGGSDSGRSGCSSIHKGHVLGSVLALKPRAWVRIPASPLTN